MLTNPYYTYYCHALLHPCQMRKFILLFCFIIPACIVQASTTDSTKHISKKTKLRLVPVISYAPETRLLFGVGGLLPFQCYGDSATHHSLVEAFVAYTQNNQDYIYVPYWLYSKDNNYYFEGEADYYNYSYYYWGIGTNRVAEELYNVRFPKLSVSAYRRVLPHFYAGIDYYYENDVIWKTEDGGALSTGEITGSKGSANSGAGIDLLYDTRDSIYYPHNGWYIKANSYFDSPTLGATYSYQKFTGSIAWYKSLSAGTILALNEFTQIMSGTIPFNQMALVGGTKQIRGYYAGYYRDDDLTYAQAELRVHLIGRFGAVAFASEALFGNAHVFPESPGFIPAEGVGLRYNYNVKHHINLRGDVGYGKSVEYYFTIQEAF